MQPTAPARPSAVRLVPCVRPLDIMTIESGLAVLCEMLRAQTGVEVFLSRPDDAVAGIYVWPWRLWEEPIHRNLPEPVSPAIEVAHRASAPNVDFLVLVRPALTLDGLSSLSEARQAMLDNPILTVDGTAANLTLDPMPPGVLLNIFSAAAIPLTVCLSATLRGRG
jgi:hypothetical protein